MITKGIRGAVTVEENSESSIKKATLLLLNEMIAKNNIDVSNISHVIFTLTNDLNAAFPAKFARQDLGWNETAMMCFHELDVPGSLKMCLRTLIVLNCEENFKPQFVYLKEAAKLRK
ncbi:MAG: chorismate mutase [Candidatus Gastranaerophilaceae bacterium]